MRTPIPNAPRRGITTVQIALIILGLALAIGISMVIIWRAKVAADPYYHFRRGVEAWNRGDTRAAYPLLKEAATRGATNAQYWQLAAQAAGAVGQRTEAAQFARQAWDLGVRSADQIRLMAARAGTDPAADLAQALALLGELPDDRTNRLIRADLYLSAGRPDDAAGIWQQLLEQQAEPGLVVKLATAHLARGEVDAARALLEAHRVTDELDTDGYRLLAALDGLDDTTALQTPVLFEEMRQRGLYNEETQLEHAVSLLSVGNQTDARLVLEPLIPAGTNAPQNSLRASARLYLAELYWQQRDREALQKLRAASQAAPRNPIREGEAHAYDAYLAQLDNQRAALESFRRARKLIPAHPALELGFARAAVTGPDMTEAADTLSTVGGVIGRWPALIYQRAITLARARRDIDAMRNLDALHRRGISSKESLELLRDLAYRNNLGELGQATQTLLEQRYADDSGIRAFAAYTALRQGEFDTARSIFAELSAQHPEEIQYRLGQAEVLASEGKTTEALRVLDGIPGQPATVAAARALIHNRAQQWDAAAAAFAQAVEGDPAASVLIEYGRLLLRLGQPAEAARQFERALEKVPSDPEAHLGLAMIRYEAGQLVDARSHARNALFVPAEQSLRPLLLISAAELQAGDAVQALDHAQQAVGRDPASIPAKFLRARAYVATGRIPEAEQDLNAVLQADPTNADARQLMAVVQLRRGNYTRTLEMTAGLLRDQPTNVPIQLLRFEATALSGQLDQAVLQLNNLRPAVTPPQFALRSAWLAQLKRDTNAALAALEPALKDPEVALQYGLIQLRLGRAAEALRAVEGLDLGAMPLALLASAAETEKLDLAARTLYTRALTKDPKNPMILNNLAWLEIQSPGFDADKVLGWCRDALGGLPKNPSILHTYGEALVRSGRYRECLSLLGAERAVVELSPKLLVVLAQANEGAGDTTAALSTYRSALAQAQRNPEAAPDLDRAELEQRIERLVGN